jgi:MFS transporter, DHA2 family, multidrug resistance protein
MASETVQPQIVRVRPSAPAHPEINPWVIAWTVTLATFMELLDSSIANVSLPHIAGGLACSYDEATWVLTSYLVANAIVLPLSAWLSRVFGRKNYYMTCVALFTVSSLLCGLAPNLPMLILFRVLQGIGGGGLAPVEQAILVDTFPPKKRAAAFALYSMAIVAAPAIGPPLGGWITDTYDWRWVFFINVPIGILSLFLSSRFVHDSPQFQKEVAEARRSGRLKIDYIGILLVAVGFGCLEVVLDEGQKQDWLGSHFVVTFLVLAIAALVVGIIWELRHKDPVVEVSLMKERNFACACLLYFMFGFALYGSTILIPQQLQTLYGYTATQAGFALAPGALVMICMAPLVVRLTNKFQPKWLIMLACLVVSISLVRFSHFSMATDFKTYALTRALQGVGIAFFFVPISQLAYSYLPANKNNKASSLTNLFRNLGGSFGIAFVTTMAARRQQFHHSVLAQRFNEGEAALRNFVASAQQHLIASGQSPADAAHKAYGMASRTLEQQSTMLASLDSYYLLSFIVLIGVPLALVTKAFRSSGPGAGH